MGANVRQGPVLSRIFQMSGKLSHKKRSISFVVVFPNVHTCPLVSSRERPDGW